MKEIGSESTKFNTSQRLAEQAKLILKKCWFSDLEILEICEQVSREENDQEKPPTRIESQNNNNSPPNKNTQRTRVTNSISYKDNLNLSTIQYSKIKSFRYPQNRLSLFQI